MGSGDPYVVMQARTQEPRPPVHANQRGVAIDHRLYTLCGNEERPLCEVTDDSDGCGAKFTILVVSDKFQGKPLLARHRLVNSVLQEELRSIHALTQKTLTVDQWKAQ
ncbi:hypothetical protein ACJJTC_010871 [Scirpophaga incertulas]